MRDSKIIDGVEWTRLCRSTDVKEKWGFRVSYDIEHDIALFRTPEGLSALSNLCPHEKRPVISSGFVQNGEVTCPTHCWVFDIHTGRKLREVENGIVRISDGSERGLKSYNVIEREGWVWVQL